MHLQHRIQGDVVHVAKRNPILNFNRELQTKLFQLEISAEKDSRLSEVYSTDGEPK
jgi:hypothetical protein